MLELVATEPDILPQPMICARRLWMVKASLNNRSMSIGLTRRVSKAGLCLPKPMDSDVRAVELPMQKAFSTGTRRLSSRAPTLFDINSDFK